MLSRQERLLREQSILQWKKFKYRAPVRAWRKNSIRDILINMSSIEDALEALKSQKSPNNTATAGLFGVDRTTLSRRHRGISSTLDEKANKARLPTTQQEKTLTECINKVTVRAFPPTPAIVHNFAKDICKVEPAKNWVFRPNEIRIGKGKESFRWHPPPDGFIGSASLHSHSIALCSPHPPSPLGESIIYVHSYDPRSCRCRWGGSLALAPPPGCHNVAP